MTVGADDLDWQVEQTCLEGCPAVKEIVIDGWLLRQSGGKTRRTNSANPLRGRSAAPETVLAMAEAFYGDHKQTTLFRIPDIAAEMEYLTAAATASKAGPSISMLAWTS